MTNDCNKNRNNSGSPRNTRTLVDDLCNIILIKDDSPDYDSAKQYIYNLTPEEIALLNKQSKEDNKLDIRQIVEKNISDYLSEYHQNPQVSSPFEFDSAGAYQSYRSNFINIYSAKTNNAELPAIFVYVFECIKEASEQYRHFEKFINIFNHNVSNEAGNKLEKALAENAINEIITDATREATLKAYEAERMAQRAEEKAATAAERAANQAVNAEMNRVSKTVSETTVTVLGIFSAIVLSIVAGLMYSSSMLDNMNTANYFRLIAVGALVGFVCFNLIAVMLRFISKYRYASKGEEREFDTNSEYSKMMFFVSTALLVIFIFFSFLQFYVDDPIHENGSIDNIISENNVSSDDSCNESGEDDHSQTPDNNNSSNSIDGNIPETQ